MIQYFIKKKLGKNVETFTVNGDTFHEVMLQATHLSFSDLDKCGCCGGDDLFLSAHKTEKKGFEYAYARCRKCRATLNFGKQMENKDIVYYRTRDEKYIHDGKEKTKKVLDWMPYNPETIAE